MQVVFFLLLSEVQAARRKLSYLRAFRDSLSFSGSEPFSGGSSSSSLQQRKTTRKDAQSWRNCTSKPANSLHWTFAPGLAEQKFNIYLQSPLQSFEIETQLRFMRTPSPLGAERRTYVDKKKSSTYSVVLSVTSASAQAFQVRSAGGRTRLHSDVGCTSRTLLIVACLCCSCAHHVYGG